MKKIYSSFLLFVVFLIYCARVSAQINVTVTNSPAITGNTMAATYSSLSAAITALNGATITSSGSATVTIAYTSGGAGGVNETAPAGGYVITKTGTSNIGIIIDGVNTAVIKAGLQASGSVNDAVFKIVGADYITIKNFTIQENSSNTDRTVGTVSNTNTMTEFGIALYGASTTDGAKSNTIEGNTISLDATYIQTFGIMSTSTFVSTTTSSGTAPAAQTATAGGENSGNMIYSNTISSVAFGIYFASPIATASFSETGNIIGALGKGNTITYGNNSVANFTQYPLPGTAVFPAAGGITMRNSIGFTITYNSVTSNSFSIATTGILANASTTPAGVTYTNTISNNTLSLTQTANAALVGIDFGYGLSTGTLVANSNTVTLNQTVSAATTGAVTGIKSNYASATNTATGNSVTINQTTSGTGVTSSVLTGITLAGTSTTITAQTNSILFNQATTSSSAVTGTIVGIAANAVATTVNINNAIVPGSPSSTYNSVLNSGNNITVKQATSSGAGYGSGTITYINVGANSGTVNVSYNQLNTTGSTILNSGTVTGIDHSAGAFTTALTIDHNVITIDRSAPSGSSPTFGTNSTSVVSTSTNAITGNKITFTGSIVSSGTSAAIQEIDGGASSIKNISSDTISVTMTGHTGQWEGIRFGFNTASTSATASNISDNFITISTSTGSVFNGISVVTNANSTTATTINNNSISLTTASTATAVTVTIIGINTQVAGKYTISNNTISKLSITGSSALSALTIYGIQLLNSPTSGTHTIDVFKNKIYGLATNNNITSLLLSGIRVNATATSGSTTFNIYNNLIGFDNTATPNVSNVADAVRGISFTNAVALVSYNVYYNTIYMACTGAASPTAFGTSGIFHTISTTSTTSALTLRNNIIINNSTPGGTGLTVALRRSAGAASNLANYGSASDNNLLYAGTPGTSNLIYSDGTSSAQTLANYTGGVFTAGTISPRDANSKTESSTTFLSLSGASSNFLHLDPNTASVADNGAANITGYTTDYDGHIRYGNAGYPGGAAGYPSNGTSPDIGADEYEVVSCVAPSAITGSFSLTPGNTTVTGTITITSGAPSGGYLVVRTTSNTAPTPVDGTTYSVGAGLGGYIEMVGSISAVNSTGLTNGTTYYYWVFSYNNCSGTFKYSTAYLTTSAVPNNPCNTPSAQPTSLILTQVNNTTIGGSFTAASPAPSGYIVVRTPTSTPPTNPANGSTYTVGTNANYFGTNTYVEAVGTGTTFTSSSLTFLSTYWYWVFAYNSNCTGQPYYLTTSPLTGSLTLSCPSGGPYTVGPTGNFASITEVKNTLVTCGLSANTIFELQSTYNSSVETFPITIPNFTNSNLYTVTFRPATGATSLAITSSSSSGTFILDGGNNIIFDGRPGGSGTSRELTIQNTNSAGSTLRFINDAKNNIVRYANIRSRNAVGTPAATIIFSTTTGSTGNDNNLIEYNDIYDAAGGNPVYAIYSLGTTTLNSNYNSSISISNNNIYNFYNATNAMSGIFLSSGNTDWTITGNSFYHTSGTITLGSSYVYSAITANDNLMNNMVITNNYIGGTATQAGGSKLTIDGAGILKLILANLGTSATSSISGNRISNISYTTTNVSSAHTFISIEGGNISVGSVGSPNIIGSQTATNNIDINLNGGAGTNFSAINAGLGTQGNVDIIGNKIGGINIGGSSANSDFEAIWLFGATGGNVNVTDNTIGSTTTANSINHSLNTRLLGIYFNKSSTATHTISNNIIANLYASNTGTSSYLDGINTVNNTSIYQISGNTIYNLNTACTNTSVVSLAGIYATATASGQNISSNIIYGLYASAPSVKINMAGIYYAGPTTVTANSNNIEKNFIHSLDAASSVTTSNIYGIYSASTGTVTMKNNMIRLGINSSGNSITTAYAFNGIYELSGTPLYYFNSIYIGGSGVGAGSASYAFNSGTTTGTRTLNNNIFWNDRSNTSGTSPKHYSVYFAGITNLSSNYNDLIATGNGKVLAFNGTTDFSSLATWRSTTSQDANSLSSYPQFLLPGGTSSTVDLHLNSGVVSLMEQSGTAIAAVTDDYDNQTRASYTPTDIGADADNLTAATKIDVGVTALASPLSAGCLSSTQSVVVTIKNYGTSTIDFSVTPVTVTVNITGQITATLNGTINTGTLAANATTDVTMSATVDMSASGTYNFSMTTSAAGSLFDRDITNDVATATRTTSALAAGTVSSSTSGYCRTTGTPTLTLTGSTGGNIQWQENTIGSSGPWTNVGTNSATYTPSSAVTVNTWYRAVVSCGSNNATSNTVTVAVNNPVLSSTAGDTRCGTGTVTLTGSVDANSTLTWYTSSTGGSAVGSGSPFTPTVSSTTTYYAQAEGSVLGSSGNAQFGTATTTNATTLYPSPYSNYYGGVKSQMLIRASELTGAGVPAGNITAISFIVAAVGIDFSGTLNGFQIDMKNTSSTTLNSSTFETGMNSGTTTVYGPLSQSIPTSGFPATVTHTLTTPFNWDGTSNIAIQVVFSNYSWTSDTYVQMRYTTTSFNSTNYYRKDYVSAATILSAASPDGVSTSRPNMILTYGNACASTPRVAVVATVNPAPALTLDASSATICRGTNTNVNVTSGTVGNYTTYTWAPSTGATTSGSPDGASVTLAPTTTTVYTVTGNGGGCTNTASVTVNVNNPPSGVTAAATPSTVCSGSSITLSSTGSGAITGYTLSSITYSLNAMTGSTTLASGGTNNSTGNFSGGLDDGYWTNIPIGFSFNFYNNTYSTLAISTNGNVQFGPTFSSNYSPSAIPNTGVPNNYIGGMWIDLNFSSTGTIKYLSTGTTPNRIFYVEWNGVTYSDGDAVQVQVALFENNNSIEVHLKKFTNTSGYRSFVLGIENGSGTDGLAATGRNNIYTSTAANEAWRFSTIGSSTFAWTGPNSYTAAIQNPAAITNAQTVNAGNYKVVVTGSNGCKDSATVAVAVNYVTSAPTGLRANNAASLSVCSGTTVSLTKIGGYLGTGATWKWYSDNTYTTLVGTVATADTATAKLDITTSTPGTVTYYLRSEGGAAPCATSSVNAAGSVTVTTIATGTWLGLNTSWGDASNWCGGLPGANTNVIIPDYGGLAFYPIISTGLSALARNITIGTNASITIDPNASLAISGSFTNNGTFTNNGEVILNSSTTSQSFPGSTGTISSMKMLTINNTSGLGVTLNRAMTIDSVFTPTAGAITLSNAVITLKSTASNTARVGQVGGGASFLYSGSGKFEVQRYFNSRRAWRLATAPLSNTGSIYDNWQNGGVYTPGVGTFVTGPNPTGASGNGLDYSGQNNYSLKTYVNNAYVNIGDTKTGNLSGTASSAANTGYFIFVRGDRSRSPDNTILGNSNITTLSSFGKLQYSDQSFAVNTTNNTYSLVGNPFASPVDFNALDKQSVFGHRFYVFDPNLSTVGAFVTMEDFSTPSQFFPTAPYGASTQNNHIQSGQAFFVQTDLTGPTPTLTFKETHKSVPNNQSMFRPSSPAGGTAPAGSMIINLHLLDAASQSTILADGVFAQFDDQFTAGVDKYDALKFTNINENLALYRNNYSMSVERRPQITVMDTLFLRLTRTVARDYRFELIGRGLSSPDLQAFLEDRYLNSRTQLNLDGRNLYDFTINGDAASAAADRFRIVFSSTGGGVIPVTFTNIRAYQQNNDIAVEWQVQNQLNITGYVIEKSLDGRNFSQVGTVSATTTGTNAAYQWLDIHAKSGVNYYRIRSVGVNGTIGYSSIAKVLIGKGAQGITVYPNPSTADLIGIQFMNMPKGRYAARLFNNAGQLIYSTSLQHSGGSASVSVRPATILAKGIYQLELKGDDGKPVTLKVSVE